MRDLLQRLDALGVSPAVLALGACCLVLWVLWRRAATRVGRGNRRRGDRARRAEFDAEDLLAEYGWTVVDRQVTRRWPMEVDGELVEATLRADLLVEQDGFRFVAEVKTGRDATRPTFPSTRRQLLEYRLAFPVDGVLLVDMEAGEVVEVVFPELG